MTKLKNTRVATEILDELNGRSGYDNLWDDLDEDLRKEIKDAIIEILEQYYETA